MFSHIICPAIFFILINVTLGKTLAETYQYEDETERIVGGDTASKNMFPWMVALFYKGEFVCTASIISERDVLTAGHCVVFNKITQNPADYHGIIGSVNKNQGERITFSSIKPHPDYDNLLNDLAVLNTDKEIPLSASVQPICLGTSKLGCLRLKPVTAIGWGITTRNTSVTETPDNLKYTKLRVYPNSKCSVLYFNIVPKTIICAGSLKNGVCSGDSGGPLVLNVGKKKTAQVGVTAFVNNVFGCARLLGPAGFTSVSHYTDFIRSETKGKPCFI